MRIILNTFNLRLLIFLFLNFNINYSFTQTIVEQTIESRIKSQQNSEDIKKLNSDFYKFQDEVLNKIISEFEKNNVELKSFKEDIKDRGETVDWWLSILGLVIAVFSIVLPIGGYIFGRKLYKDINHEKNEVNKSLNEFISEKTKEFEIFASQTQNKLRVLLHEAQRHTDEIKSTKENASIYFDLMKEEFKPENFNKETFKESTTKKMDDFKTDSVLVKLLQKLQEMDAVQDDKNTGEILRLTEEIIAKTEDVNILSEMHLIRSNTYSNLFEIKKAEEEIKKSIDYNPTFFKYWFNLGNILFNQGKITEAENAYIKSIELGPTEFKLFAGFANFYYNQEQYSLAKPHALKAVELGGGNQELLLLGNIYYSLGAYQDSINIYTQLVERDENNVSYWSNLGLIYFKLELFKEALKCLSKSVNLDPKNPMWIDQKGAILCALEKYDDAEKCFEKAIDLDHNYIHGYFNLYEIYLFFKTKEQTDQLGIKMSTIPSHQLERYFGFHFLKSLERIIYSDDFDFKMLCNEFENIIRENNLTIEWGFQDLRNMLRQENVVISNLRIRQQIIQFIDFVQNLKSKIMIERGNLK